MPRLPRTLRLILLGGVTLAVLGAIAAVLLVMSLSSRLPDVQTLRTTELQEPMYVYASDGRLMGLFGEMRRYPVDINDVPLRVKQAFLAAEDNRFYQHHGVDYKGTGRAIWLVLTTGSKNVPGGSTNRPGARPPRAAPHAERAAAISSKLSALNASTGWLNKVLPTAS